MIKEERKQMYKEAEKLYFNHEYEKALPLYETLAADNHAVAQCTLGEMYLYGDGVNVDVDKAMELFIQSVKNGFHPAEKPLSRILQKKWNEEMIKIFAASPEILEIVINPLVTLIPEENVLVVTFLFVHGAPSELFTQELQNETIHAFENYFNGRFKVYSATATIEHQK